MKVLHIVPEINEANGVYQVARMLARESGGEVIDARQFHSINLNNRTIEQFSEVWVHGMWLPHEWKACWKVLRNVRMFECSNVRPKLVRMTHGSLSPIYLEKQGKWKKRLVAPIERWLFRRTDRVVVTCEAEKKWCQEWGLRNEFEILDLKKFFKFQVSGFKFQVSGERPLHLLYLGRRHPLKGIEFLERAVREIGLGQRPRSTMVISTDGEKDAFGGRTEVVTRLDEYGNAKANLGEVTVIVQHKRNKQTPPPKFRPLTEVVETVAKHQAAGFSPSTTVNSVANLIGPRKGAMRDVGEVGSRTVELRIVSDHFGEELEKDWAWCDVLVLPTLSENFGRVVAEALERGKRVITTDGAPAWEPPEAAEVKVRGEGEQWRDRIIYLKGYRDGTDEERVRLLKEALGRL